MDCAKVGAIIRKMRLEKGMTQRELAEKLTLSDKTVSKWERGLGCPDISLLSELSYILEVSMDAILTGELLPNTFVGGNMKNAKYYVCPSCGNVTVCTGEATVSCCGRRLDAMQPAEPDASHALVLERVEDDWFITCKHPMEKEHNISFVAFASGDRIQLYKRYPEWDLQCRLPTREHGMLMWYCTEHGLFAQRI